MPFQAIFWVKTPQRCKSEAPKRKICIFFCRGPRSPPEWSRPPPPGRRVVRTTPLWSPTCSAELPCPTPVYQSTLRFSSIFLPHQHAPPVFPPSFTRNPSFQSLNKGAWVGANDFGRNGEDNHHPLFTPVLAFGTSMQWTFSPPVCPCKPREFQQKGFIGNVVGSTPSSTPFFTSICTNSIFPVRMC